jgi:hypothetical protein
MVLFSSASFVAGALVALGAAYAILRPSIQLFGSAPLTHAKYEGTIDLFLLRKLRSGDSAGAIDLLEAGLDGGIVSLGSYLIYSDDKTLRAEAERTLAKIAEYRRQFPSTQPDLETRKFIEDALNHASKSTAPVP